MSKYKIGLITADETSYAGGVYGAANSNYYLYTGVNYWTMSPFNFSTGDFSVLDWGVWPNGSLDDTYIWRNIFVRPVINLNPNVEVISGNGTSSSPYVIKTN